MLYAKGIRRTAVRLVVVLAILGCVIVGCAKENIWAIRGTSK